MTTQDTTSIDLFAQFAEWAFADPATKCATVVPSGWDVPENLPEDLLPLLERNYTYMGIGCDGNSLTRTVVVHNDKQYKVVLKGANAQRDAPRVAKLLAQEIKVWRLLKHPNIVPFLGLAKGLRVHPVFLEETLGYAVPSLVSIYCEGGSIGSYLKEKPQTTRLPLVQDVVRALNYLHTNNIVHGDIKPNNILIHTHEGGIRAALMDFGLSHIIGEEGFEGVGFVSRRYVAPEISFSSEANRFYTPQADIFAFAVTTLEVISDRPAFPHGNADMASLSFWENQVPERPDHPSEEMTDTIWQLLQECWDLNPLTRPTIMDVSARLK